MYVQLTWFLILKYEDRGSFISTCVVMYITEYGYLWIFFNTVRLLRKPVVLTAITSKKYEKGFS